MKQHRIENRFIPAFIFSSGIYAVITPYLPLMVSYLGYSTILVGVLLGIFEGAGIAGPFVFGSWADRTGKYRLPLILTCIIPALTAFPLALFVHPLVSALLLIILAFSLKPNNSLLDAVTTIYIGTKGNYGKIRVWGSIGFVLITLFLQWTPLFKPANEVSIAFWITLICTAAIVTILILPLKTVKSTLKEKQAEIPTSKDIISNRNEKTRIISKYFIAGFILIFFSRFSMAAFNTFFSLYLIKIIQWDAIGLMFALGVLTEIPCFFFSDVLIRRFGSMPLLALSAAAVCVRLLLWALFPYKPFIVIAQLLHSLCFGIYYPAAINFISGVFPPEKRGFGMSILLAFGSGMPILIGNMIGGVIVEAAGYRSLFAIYAAVSGLAVLVYGILNIDQTNTHKLQ